jgi:hypothetical protein
MGDVAKEGRTVILVSHNTVAVRQLCDRCLWLEGGEIRKFGFANDIVGEYILSHAPSNDSDVLGKHVKGDGRVELLSYRVTNSRKESHPLPTTNEDILINVHLNIRESINQPACGISITNEYGILMTCINTVEQGISLARFPRGELNLAIRLANVAFLPGRYTGSLWIMSPQGHIYAMAEDVITFEIGQSPIYGTCQIDHRWGCVYTSVEFSPEAVSTGEPSPIEN